MRGSEIRFGVSLPFYGDFNSLMDYALTAEEAGYDSIWMPDHVFFPHEMLTTLAAMAVKTERLRLGTSVIDPNRRNPALIAHMATTLDIISGGRLIMGVGRGVWNEASYGYRLDKPVSRMRETVEVVKRFWTEPKVDHKGEFFTYEGASIGSKPLQKPHPPIWIAGFGPRMLKIAGELGD
ncbi:MAG: LLM class flavin-dependent oxidoreductase, partial [Candidatus Bathyarchaeia archaeon]